MKLYEVNQMIEGIFEQLVDPETGEIVENEALLAQLDSLQMERSRILEYLAKLVLNTRSQMAALKEEEKRLKERRASLERKDTRLMEILDRECAGEKTDCGVATVCYRKTTKVEVGDDATAVSWLMENGHIPSFCTACYREGRTGDRFMSLCKSGQILNCCHPNALMTLTEYLVDYASDATKEVGYKMVEDELERIPKEKVRGIAKDNIAAIKASNRRDFRF